MGKMSKKTSFYQKIESLGSLKLKAGAFRERD